MKTAWPIHLLGLILLASALRFVSSAHGAPKNILIVTVTAGFWHSSIPTAEKVLGEMARESGAFTVDFARVNPNDARFKAPNGKVDGAKVNAVVKEVLAEKMSPAALSNYDAVIFANTSGELPLPDKSAFLSWIKSGKGFLGMHAAADTLHEFKPYLQMLGGEFLTHGGQDEVDAINEDQKCPACLALPAHWKLWDEIYLFQNFERDRVHELLMLDKSPLDGSPGHFPISWCKTYGKGRVFYTSLGHREDLWDTQTPGDYHRVNSAATVQLYRAHVLSALKWVLRLEEWDVNFQRKAR
jgi:type 1 glutamine amidotransferase